MEPCLLVPWTSFRVMSLITFLFWSFRVSRFFRHKYNIPRGRVLHVTFIREIKRNSKFLWHVPFIHLCLQFQSMRFQCINRFFGGLIILVHLIYFWCVGIRRSHWVPKKGCTVDDPSVWSEMPLFESMCESSRCHNVIQRKIEVRILLAK